MKIETIKDPVIKSSGLNACTYPSHVKKMHYRVRGGLSLCYPGIIIKETCIVAEILRDSILRSSGNSIEHGLLNNFLENHSSDNMEVYQGSYLLMKTNCTKI